MSDSIDVPTITALDAIHSLATHYAGQLGKARPAENRVGALELLVQGSTDLFALFRAAYERLFRSGIPLSRLKDAAFGGRLFSDQPEKDGLGVAGRSLAWKVLSRFFTGL